VVVLAGTGLILNLVVVSGSTSSRFCDGGPPGRGMCLRSTQHLMDWEGQEMSSLTSSQSKEAKAWRHFPGQSLTSAVFVIVPNKPEIRPPHPGPCCGLCRAGLLFVSESSAATFGLGNNNFVFSSLLSDVAAVAGNKRSFSWPLAKAVIRANAARCSHLMITNEFCLF